MKVTWGILFLFTLPVSAFASSYTGYDCNALNPSSSWNCPCGCGYSNPGPTPPENCETTFTSTSTSSSGGPHNECTITTYQNTTNYNCQFEFYPSEYSTYTTYNCKLTAADCSPGETFLPYVCGCIAGAPSCVAPGSTPAPITTVSSTEGGTDSGCQRRWKQITQRIQPGFIPGDKYSYFSATVVASNSDSPTTIATKMAAAINSYATKLGVWYSVGFSASSSGDTITIKEPWQAGLNQVSSYRPHPACTPTPTPSPTPTPAMSVPTPAPTAVPTSTPAPTPSQTCSGAVNGATSPCSCAANATGTLSGNNLTCSCNSGFHLSGSSCVQDPCSGPGAGWDGMGQCTCSGSNVNTTPNSGVCSCNAGYHASGSACVQDPCSGPGSALNGSGVCTCSGTNVNPIPTGGVCSCNPGSYDNGSGQCVTDTCTGVGAGNDGNGQCTCPANASVGGSGTNKTCTCNAGFAPDGTNSSCIVAPTCVFPEVWDGSTCKFDPTKHACNVGSGSTPTSAVSSDVGGADATARFNNTVNKKLACCLNYQNSSDTYAKFDCVENAKTFYADFNALWTSADDNARGGQLNAIVLAGSNGKPLTGFYTASGQRCEEFSEFSSGTIQPGKVDAAVQVGQMNRTGQSSGFDAQGKAPLSKPSAAMYSTMASKFGKSVPTSTADRRRCPILVRAAVLTACPSNPQVPGAAKRTYEESGTRRCAVASSVQVQVRVEQIWEIAGQPLAKPIDTVLDPMAASSISVEKIIANKYGSSCPPGTTKQGDTCVY